ncbi:hypothetical protein [Bacillus pumilus]|uniref:hypothetical protein n=1 Tax=Bacillus pumilus TaxID=1408 RepID=UPI003F7C9D49
MKTNKSIIATILLVFVLALTTACSKTEISSETAKETSRKEANTASKPKETKAVQEAYVDWYDSHMNALEDEINNYRDLLTNSVPGDKTWVSKVDKSLVGAQRLVDKASKKEDIPAEFKTAHKHVLRAGKEYQFIIDNTSTMLSEYDPELKLMQDVVTTMDNVVIEIENADNEVDRIVDEKQLKN